MITRRGALATFVGACVVAFITRRHTPAGQNSGAEATPPVGPSLADAPVGSAAVLAALWSADALRGGEEEAKVRRQRPPDRRPPERTTVPATAALEPPFMRSIRRVEPKDGARLVALTFDLCERADETAGYDGAIVDLLRREQVRATFFAGGKWMRSRPERAMQLIADPLFEVGNHGWTHGNLRVLEGEAAEQQIVWAQAQYALLRDAVARRAAAAGLGDGAMAAIPPLPTAFRFPYGTCKAETLALPARFGLAAIQWDVISGDAVAGQPAATVEREVLAWARPGSIIVFHANGRGSGTAGALPGIIAGLRRRGYRFVTIATLLAAGLPVTAETCYERRPGDNGRYDKLFGAGTG